MRLAIAVVIVFCGFMASIVSAWCDVNVKDGIEHVRLGCLNSGCSAWCGTSFVPSALHVSKPWELSVDCGCKSSNCSCSVSCENDQGEVVTQTADSAGRTVVSNCVWNLNCALNGVDPLALRRDSATCNVLSYSEHNASKALPGWAVIVIAVVLIAVCISGIVCCCWWCSSRTPIDAAASDMPRFVPDTQPSGPVTGSPQQIPIHSAAADVSRSAGGYPQQAGCETYSPGATQHPPQQSSGAYPAVYASQPIGYPMSPPQT
jgi:hypothetical protein